MVYQIVKQNEFGDVSAGKIQEFEKELSILLPEEYKYFLLKCNGGKPVCEYFTHLGKIYTIQYIFGIHDGDYYANLKARIINFRDVLEAGYIPFASDWGGNLFLICLHNTENYGNIFFFDHNLGGEDENGSDIMPPLDLLADNFNSFLESLEHID
jgi:hypothetical protein